MVGWYGSSSVVVGGEPMFVSGTILEAGILSEVSRTPRGVVAGLCTGGIVSVR